MQIKGLSRRSITWAVKVQMILALKPFRGISCWVGFVVISALLKLFFTLNLMKLIWHWSISPAAELRIKPKELFVASLKQVNLAVEELRIEVKVKSAINFTQSSVHLRASMLREFTVKDYHSLCGHQWFNRLLVLKEELFHHFRSWDV